MVNNNSFIIGVVFTSLWLSGCSIINPKPSPAIDVYTLSQEMEQAQQAPSDMNNRHARILALSPIRSPQGLMSTGIIYRDVDYGFNSYAYSRWSDSPNKLLSNYFQQYLTQSQHISAVIPVGSKIDADLLLEATLVDFSHHLETNVASTTAVVSIIFYLINAEDKTLLATKQFIEKVPVEKQNAKDATISINHATKLVTLALQKWLETNIASLPQK